MSEAFDWIPVGKCRYSFSRMEFIEAGSDKSCPPDWEGIYRSLSRTYRFRGQGSDLISAADLSVAMYQEAALRKYNLPIQRAALLHNITDVLMGYMVEPIRGGSKMVESYETREVIHRH